MVELPAQNDALPVIVGVVGIAFTVTATTLLSVADEQPEGVTATTV